SPKSCRPSRRSWASELRRPPPHKSIDALRFVSVDLLQRAGSYVIVDIDPDSGALGGPSNDVEDVADGEVCHSLFIDAENPGWTIARFNPPHQRAARHMQGRLGGVRGAVIVVRP